jgi:hypothetical protein
VGLPAVGRLRIFYDLCAVIILRAKYFPALFFRKRLTVFSAKKENCSMFSLIFRA